MDKSDRLNVVFFGEDSFSDIVLKSLIEAGHKVRLVVTPYYENNIYKRMAVTCERNGIQLLRAKKINSDEVCNAVWSTKPDIGVISHFERLIKRQLLDIPRLGFINLHPSLLPDYRGMAPQHWPIINRDKETGITVHYVDEAADTGDIILQRKIPLAEDMYVSDLQMRWREEYKTIVVEAINRILSGAPVIHQKDMPGRYYGKLTEDQRLIDMHGSVHDAYAKVRGLSLPYAGAKIGNNVILRAHISELNGGGYMFKDGVLVPDLCRTERGVNEPTSSMVDRSGDCCRLQKQGACRD